MNRKFINLIENTELDTLICNNDKNYLTKLKIMNCDDINKKSYLQLAIVNKTSDDTIILLLEKGCDIDVLDENNNNILHLLIQYFNENWYRFTDMYNIFKIFNDNHKNHKNNDGNTPLHYAFMYNLKSSYIKLLITEQNINLSNNLNKTPLELLIENDTDYEYFFKKFIDNVNDFYNIIKTIIKKNNLNYLKYIISLKYNPDIYKNKNFNFNKIDEDGNSLLHLSILYDSSFKIIYTLLMCNFILYNHQNNDGNTVLHLAVRKKYNKENIKIVNYLIRFCDKKIKNNNNQTPFDILNLHKHSSFKSALYFNFT
jgi:ankyrin repeat protein